jgi:hypothetical protein
MRFLAIAIAIALSLFDQSKAQYGGGYMSAYTGPQSYPFGKTYPGLGYSQYGPYLPANYKAGHHHGHGHGHQHYQHAPSYQPTSNYQPQQAYSAPSAPAYNQPAAPSYSAPSAPAYTQPAAPSYSAPAPSNGQQAPVFYPSSYDNNGRVHIQIGGKSYVEDDSSNSENPSGDSGSSGYGGYTTTTSTTTTTTTTPATTSPASSTDATNTTTPATGGGAPGISRRQSKVKSLSYDNLYGGGYQAPNNYYYPSGDSGSYQPEENRIQKVPKMNKSSKKLNVDVNGNGELVFSDEPTTNPPTTTTPATTSSTTTPAVQMTKTLRRKSKFHFEITPDNTLTVRTL